MCGIAGIINFNKKSNTLFLEKMLNSMNFRGPDNKVSVSGNFYDIGMVRLSIIDLSQKGNQPFLSEDKKISVIYNGEIYNYEELKNQFFPNYRFSSTCDGEIIPLMYKKFGMSFIEYLKGMFAIAIIDTESNELILIRDRFGIKPLYYHFNKTNSELTFASEIHTLLKNEKIEKKENYAETNRYLNFGLVSSTNETWFKDVYQIEPGQFLKFSKGNFTLKKYYQIEKKIDENVDKANVNYFEIEKKTFNLLEKSFKEHAISDQTIGIHISGGNDSAALAVGCKKIGLKTKCFTFDYEESQFSERKAANDIANALNFDHFSATIKKDQLISEFEKVVQIQFEPFSSLRIVSQNFLYENFKDNCRVILDGSGGDEIASGYKYHQVAWLLDMQKDGYKNPEKKLYQLVSDQETLDKKQFIKGSLLKLSGDNNVTEDGSIFSKKNILNINNLKKYPNEYKFLKPFKSVLRNAQYKDLMYTKLPRCLRYVDRASMRYSIETRLPLLDHEVVEQMFSIPTKFKYINGYQRYVLKRFCNTLLSKDLVFKNKRTIADPQSQWLKTVFKKYIIDILNSKFAKEDEIINSDYLLKNFEELFKSTEHFNSFFLFQCLNYLIWKKNILIKK